MIRTEEEDAEADFRSEFRSPTTAFQDLLDGHPSAGDEPGNEVVSAEAGGALPESGTSVRPAELLCDAKSACFSHVQPSTCVCGMQSELLRIGAQAEVAALHACVIAAAATRLDIQYGARPSPHLSAHETQAALRALATESACALSLQVLALEDGALPSWLGNVATGGVLRQLNAQLVKLSPSNTALPSCAPSAFSPSAATKGTREGLDMAKPCLQEALLAVSPVSALRVRVKALLKRYEEQPQLVQLQRICDRILGARKASAVDLGYPECLPCRRMADRCCSRALCLTLGLIDDTTTADFLLINLDATVVYFLSL